MSDNDFEPVVVGDLNSNAKGAGARRNGSKPDYSLIILKDMPTPDLGDCVLYDVWDALRDFQLKGEATLLQSALSDVADFVDSRIGEFEGIEYNVFDPVTRAWAFGEKKYNAWNWVKGMPWRVPFACAVRHLMDCGKDFNSRDKESGEYSWAHLVCNLQMLLLYTRIYPEGNDLPYKVWEKWNLDSENQKPISKNEVPKTDSDFSNSENENRKTKNLFPNSEWGTFAGVPWDQSAPLADNPFEEVFPDWQKEYRGLLNESYALREELDDLGRRFENMRGYWLASMELADDHAATIQDKQQMIEELDQTNTELQLALEQANAELNHLKQGASHE